MSPLHVLQLRNDAFARDFSGQAGPARPGLATIVVTCADPRVDPAHFLKLEPGEAVVLRNPGGRITADVVRDLATLLFLGTRMGGARPGGVSVAVIHHTQCGATHLSDPEVQRALCERLGVEAEAVAAVAIDDPRRSVAEDVERLRAAHVLPDGLRVSGHVYDVTDGRLHEVVPPTPLRTTK